MRSPSGCARNSRRSAAKAGARLKVVEVPPGPPVQAPLVAEIYGPDEAGRQALASRVAKAFGDTAHVVGIDTSLQADAPRSFLRVQRQRAETLGISVASVAQTVQSALMGVDTAYLHDRQSKYPVPMRIQLPLERQIGLDALLALPMRSASGTLVPLSELVVVEKGVIDKTLFTKDLLPVSYVMGDVGARPLQAADATAGFIDSPLYGLFGIRSRLAEAALPRHRRRRRILDPPAVRPVPQLRHQVGWRVADHLRDLPRHGCGVRGRPDPDLPAGGRAVPQLPHAA
jgi:hypothetical protein